MEINSIKPGKIVGKYDEVSLIRAVLSIILAGMFALISFAIIGFDASEGFDFVNWMGGNVRFVDGINLSGNYEVECDAKITPIESSKQIIDGCKVATKANSKFDFVTKKGTEIRLGQTSEIKLISSTDNTIVFSGTSGDGSVWIGNLVSGEKIIFDLKQVSVLSVSGSTGIRWNNYGVIVDSAKGISEVKIFSDSEAGVKKELASILIPPNYSLEIPYERINANTSRLYYSKLIKEFPLSFVTQEKANEDKWLSENISADRKQLYFRRNALKELIAEKSQSFSPLYANTFLFTFSQGLTFSSTKKMERNIERFDYFTAKMANQYILKNNTLANKYADELSLLVSGVIANDISGEIKSEMKLNYAYWKEVLTVSYQDVDLELFKSDFTTKMSLLRDKSALFDDVKMGMADVYRLMEDSSSQSKVELQKLNDLLKYDVLSLNKQLFLAGDVKAIRNLLWSLLFRYDELYSVDYFEGLILLNDKIISSLESDELRTEEVQLVIQSYLRNVSKIIALVKNESLGIERAEAVKLADKLLAKIISLHSDQTGNAAIIEYFDEQTAKFIDEIEFIKSSSFRNMMKKGYDEMYYKKSLEEFLRLREERKRVQEIVSGEESGIKVAEIPLNVATSEAKAVDLFIKHGISYRGLKIDEKNPRIVIIVDGSLSGVIFQAQLDVKTEYLFNLVVDDNKISSGIKIDDLGNILSVVDRIKRSGDDDNKIKVDISGGVKKEFSLLESLLKEIAIKRLNSLGLSVTDAQISSVDSVGEIVTVVNTKWLEQQTEVSFEYNLKRNLFTKISIFDESVDGVFTLEEFEILIYDRVEQILAEKAKAEALIEAEKLKKAEDAKMLEEEQAKALEARIAEEKRIDDEQKKEAALKAEEEKRMEIERLIEDKLKDIGV